MIVRVRFAKKIDNKIDHVGKWALYPVRGTQTLSSIFDNIYSGKFLKLIKSSLIYNKRQYNQRGIQVEHSSFKPLVFSAYGGTGQENTSLSKYTYKPFS